MSMCKLIKKEYDSYCVTFRNIRRLSPARIKEIFSAYGELNDVVAVGYSRLVLYKNYEDARKCIENLENDFILLEEHKPSVVKKKHAEKHSSSSDDSDIIINKCDKFIRKEWKGFAVVFQNDYKLKLDAVKIIFCQFGLLQSVRRKDDENGHRYVYYKKYADAKRCVEEITHPDVSLIEAPAPEIDENKKNLSKRNTTGCRNRFKDPSYFIKQTKNGSFSLEDYLDYSQNNTCDDNEKAFESMKVDNSPVPDCGEDISFNDKCLLNSITEETNGSFSLSEYIVNNKIYRDNSDKENSDLSDIEEDVSSNDELNPVVKETNESFNIIDYLEKLKEDNACDENENVIESTKKNNSDQEISDISDSEEDIAPNDEFYSEKAKIYNACDKNDNAIELTKINNSDLSDSGEDTAPNDEFNSEKSKIDNTCDENDNVIELIEKNNSDQEYSVISDSGKDTLSNDELNLILKEINESRNISESLDDQLKLDSTCEEDENLIEFMQEDNSEDNSDQENISTIDLEKINIKKAAMNEALLENKRLIEFVNENRQKYQATINFQHSLSTGDEKFTLNETTSEKSSKKDKSESYLAALNKQFMNKMEDTLDFLKKDHEHQKKIQLPCSVMQDSQAIGEKKIKILNASAVIIGNIPLGCSEAYLLHLFSEFEPLAISRMQYTPNKNIGYVFIYFKSCFDAMQAENYFDKHRLVDKNLVVLRHQKLTNISRNF